MCVRQTDRQSEKTGRQTITEATDRQAITQRVSDVDTKCDSARATGISRLVITSMLSSKAAGQPV